jgi:uncharacterized membrane protein YphA (DoxX/SURF4 family)
VRALRHPLLHGALAVLLGALFLYAAKDKIAQPAEFAKIVYHYRLVGPNHTLGYVPANTLAVTLPWVEAVTGGLLILGLWRREAAAIVSAMLVVFLIAVGQALLRGINIENCGCFGVGDSGRGAGLLLILEDLSLLGVSLFLTLLTPAPWRRVDGPDRAL